MDRPSEAVLAWLRERIDARGLKTSKVAKAIGVKTPEFRKQLAGDEPMFLDDFVRLGDVLGLDASDIAGLPEAPAEVPELTLADPDDRPHCQAETLIRMAFDQGIDLHLRFIEAQLGDWGGPDSAREPWVGKDMPIQLVAQYHRYMAPELDDQGLHVTLSFDGLYRCTFPWASVRVVTFVPLLPPPLAPDNPPPTEPPRSGRPTLRLVE